MLTCKKLEQRAVFDIDKLLKMTFPDVYEIRDHLSNLIYFKHKICKDTM